MTPTRLPFTIPAGATTITASDTGPSFISCSFQGQDPDMGINTQYCVCSGSTFSASLNTRVTPVNSCAYTTLPTSTVMITTITEIFTNTAACKVCTAVGMERTCTSISGCIPSTATSKTSTSTASSATCQITGWMDVSQVVGGGGPGQVRTFLPFLAVFVGKRTIN